MASTRSLSKVVKLLKAGQVHDNTAKNILYINFNSHTATVDYERNGDIYDLVHTDIPKELQGRGMGTIFAEVVIFTPVCFILTKIAIFHTFFNFWGFNFFKIGRTVQFKIGAFSANF